MKKEDKERKAENLLFLMLGLVFGIIGNFFVSSIIEFSNALIASIPAVSKIGFWTAYFVACSYALVWIIQRYSILLAKFGWEIFDDNEIKTMKRFRKYLLVALVLLVVLLALSLVVIK